MPEAVSEEAVQRSGRRLATAEPNSSSAALPVSLHLSDVNAGSRPLHVVAAMRRLALTTLLLAWAGTVAADDTVTRVRIKVQLFASPSFVSEVSVDAYNGQCLSLDNNL